MLDATSELSSSDRGPSRGLSHRLASGGHTSFTRRRHRKGIWFVLPFTIVFLLFTIVPLIYAVYLSFYQTKLIGGTTFAGWSNYIAIFQDSQFWGGMARVMIFAAIQIPVMLLVAFFFAVLFDIGIIKAGGIFRTIFFLPFAVPVVVSAIMWSFLLEPEFGPFTHLANSLGAHNANLLSPSLILPMIIVIVIWEWTGYNMIIMYTALRSVPREVIESALVDGASLWRIVTRVKFPLVRPAIVLLAVLNVIGAIQLFVEPSILSSFTPNISFGFTPTIFLYNTAIGNEQYNLAAAGAVILGIVIVMISVVALLVRHYSNRGAVAT